MVCVAFERVGVCPNFCGGLRHRWRGRLAGGVGGGRKWDWKGQEEGPGTANRRGLEKGKRQRPVLRAVQGGAGWGGDVQRWQMPSSA